MKKAILLLAFSIAFIINASAQFSLSAELRPRLELRHGYRTLPFEDSEMAAFISQRSRLNLSFENDKYSAFMSFQEVRVWGEKGMFDVFPGIGFNQAWFNMNIVDGLSIQAGRQQLRYDNQRLFAINNWNQVGRTHDALVAMYRINGWQMHLGGAYNQNYERLFGTEFFSLTYKTLSYFWVNKMFDKVGFSSIVVVDGHEDTFEAYPTQFRSTFGGILFYQPDRNTSIEFHGYKQNGKTRTKETIDAWYTHLVGRLKPVNKFAVNVGAEIFSGNDQTDEDSKVKAFDPLYGASHAFNGHLDYFTDIPLHTGGAGLVNPYLQVVYDLTNKIKLKADYHYFALQNKLPDESGNAIKKYLGSEIDLGVQIVFSSAIDLQFGYSTMFATESMEYLKPGSASEPIHWGWVMFTFKPVFLKVDTK